MENLKKNANGNGKHEDFDLNDDVHTGFLPAVKKDVEAGDEEEDETRHTWSKKIEYILTMMGYCVGLGNVWRFPYVCIRNGGGAFLIPFFICLIVCGIPLFFMEVAMGQFMAKGAYHVWSVCPLFKGMGMSMNVLSLIFCWYYATILSWTLVFLANSFKSPLPWTQCGQEWNSKFCVPTGGYRDDASLNGSSSGSSSGVLEGVNSTLVNLGLNNSLTSSNVSYEWTNSSEEVSNISVSATEEFWKHNVLELSPGLEYPDGIPWKNGVALLVASVIVLVCIIKGVQTVGKVVYVTATLPYLLLTILLIRGATLDGAVDGVLFYVKPDFSKLLLVQTWVEASVQVFFSLGPAWGVLITMASYNKFNNNCMKDAVVLSLVCEGTSFFAGFPIFIILGHMAHTLDVPVGNFSASGPGLAFVVYPEAISYLPIPQLWGVLFFIMLFTVGLDSQFAAIETCLTTISDLWPRFTKRMGVMVKIVFCAVLFLISLPFVTRGGMYLFQLTDWYIAAFSVSVNGILECIVIGWIYGAERLFDNIQLMIGRRPPYIFAVLWRFVTPLLLITALISTLLTYAPPTYEGYTYGPGGVTIGWIIAVVSFVPIPVYAAYVLLTTKGSFMQRIKRACTPAADWRPSDNSLMEKYNANCEQAQLCTFRLPCRQSPL